jgi:4-hydroxy-3-methylbut-2-enyl diphosphate reductase
VRDLADVPSVDEIVHYDQWTHSIKVTQNWLDTSIKPLNVAVTSGASCPDSMVDAILLRIMSWVDELRPLDDVLAPFKEQAGLSQSE